jgi:enoyl-[acyl-carrier protein] reductase I
MTHNLLKGKKGIIFGALNDKSLAWKVAEKAYEEGAEFILTNAGPAIRLGEIHKLAEKCNSHVIAADATSIDDLKEVFQAAKDKYGRIDFILHSIGMSLNVRKHIPYEALNYNYYLKTLDISALSFHKVLHLAYEMDALNEWASVIALTYVASHRTLFEYGDMADAKAALESIARNFGYIYGRDKKVRINTVSQSPTATTAGMGIKGFDSMVDFSERMSPLGNASAEECADFCVALFSDLSRKITMQNIFHDGGFSSMGMSERAIKQYQKSFDKDND